MNISEKKEKIERFRALRKDGLSKVEAAQTLGYKSAQSLYTLASQVKKAEQQATGEKKPKTMRIPEASQQMQPTQRVKAKIVVVEGSPDEIKDILKGF